VYIDIYLNAIFNVDSLKFDHIIFHALFEFQFHPYGNLKFTSRFLLHTYYTHLCIFIRNLHMHDDDRHLFQQDGGMRMFEEGNRE
jgi:hypothetical protein